MQTKSPDVLTPRSHSRMPRMQNRSSCLAAVNSLKGSSALPAEEGHCPPDHQLLAPRLAA